MTGRASIAHSIVGQRKVIQGVAEVIATPGRGRSDRPHVGDRAVGRPGPVGEPAALLLQVGEAQHRVDEVVVGAELEGVDAGAGERLAQLRLALLGGGGEALAEALVVGVDDDLLAGLGVLHRHQADVGQVHLERVEQAHRRHLVALRELAEGAFPARRADEVGDDEDRRAALDRALRRQQQLAQVGRAAGALGRARRHPLQQVEDVDAAAARRQHGVDVVAVEEGADAVAVAREQARQHGDELARDGALGEAVGAEVDARREVDQEPRRELAVLGELAHVRRLQPRRDVPVDVADVVVVLVLAQVGEVEAGAAHQRAVVALQHAVEAAQDRPLHALEERLGAVVIDQRCRLLSCGHGCSRAPAACREPGSCASPSGSRRRRRCLRRALRRRGRAGAAARRRPARSCPRAGHSFARA
jgi:hypothetical protein